MDNLNNGTGTELKLSLKVSCFAGRIWRWEIRACLPPCSSTLQIPAVCTKLTTHEKGLQSFSSSGSHKQKIMNKGTKEATVITGQRKARSRKPPWTFTTMTVRKEKWVELKKTQTLAIYMTRSAFQGTGVSADSLCKTLSAKKPKKFTACCSVPNKDGKEALLA